MRHWFQLATRSWRTRPGRSALGLASVALGVGVVVWVTCCYESVRRGVTGVVLEWIGRSHVIVEPVEGVWAVFPQEYEREIAAMPGVARTTMRTREYVEIAAAQAVDEKRPGRDAFMRIEITGVDAAKEEAFRTYRMAAGQFLSPGGERAIVLEQLLADELKVGIGDKVLLRDIDEPQKPAAFHVVGIVNRRRASVNQALMTWGRLEDVQKLCGLDGRIKAVDVILRDASTAGISRAAGEIRQRVNQLRAARPPSAYETKSLEVKTTEAEHQKLGAAQGLLQFIMMLLSCVVLLTAFFIILATMSMGVQERITELGLLRCVGVTRRQLGGLVLLQNAPLGIMGTLAGLPLGILLQWITMRLAPQYVGEMALSRWGVALAMAGGIGTTLLGAIVPAASAFVVTPADAARSHSGGRLVRWIWATAIVGAALIFAGELIKRRMAVEGATHFGASALVVLLLLYVGFAMLAPAMVKALGRAAAWVAAGMLRLSPLLLGEEIDKAPYRSAGICCGLMVGLSLIVGLVVWGASVKAGWQFPREFPDAMLYSYDVLPMEDVRALRTSPGITGFTFADDFAFTFSRPSKLSVFRSLSILDQASRFLAVEVDAGLALVKLAYLEGNERDAKAKLKQGGHVLVTREFAQARNKHLGDSLDIWVDQQPGHFVIAGVVGSPGLDIAISFFNASEYFQFYAVGAVIGTLEDADRFFGRRYGKLMLFNFDLPAGAAAASENYGPGHALPTKGAVPAPPGAESRPNFALGPGPLPGNGPEERVVNAMLEKLGHPSKAFVTARELKRQIDANIDRVTLLLSAIPLVGLLVSALGLANLMAANVASRARQIAVLRSIGVTRGQTLRIVIGEALVLGLLGSALGVALGILLGRTSNEMTRTLSGFAPPLAIPWQMLGAGALLATGLCLAAALVPALRASRTRIVAVLAG